MKEEKVKKLKEQYKKTYLDTVKHANDIEKWIDSGRRKQGDIRRSLQRLDSKYQSLLEIKKELINQNSNEHNYFNKIENELEFNKFEDQLSQKTEITMNQIKEKIQDLYKSAKIQQPRRYNKPSEGYYNNIELVTDIPGNENALYYLEKRKRFLTRKNERHIRKRLNIKELIIDKYYDIKYRFSRTRKNKKEENAKYKKVGKISALLMAGTLAIFGGTTVGESDANTIKESNNDKSYVDTNKENNFKKSLYVQALEETSTKNNVEETTIPSTVQETTIKTNVPEETWSTQATVAQSTTKPTDLEKENNFNKNTSKEQKVQNQQENKNVDVKESLDDVYILKANTEYTENSLGEGATGQVFKDTKVKIYNRALIIIDEQGNKSILYVTNPGEKWEDYAKRHGQTYEEFKRNFENPNNQEMVSLDSEDGESSYGWVEFNTLERINKVKQRGEIDR